MFLQLHVVSLPILCFSHLSYVFSISPPHVPCPSLGSRFPFPSSLLFSRLPSPWSIPCCPVHSISTVLTKTVSPQCFPFPHHQRLTLPHFYSILFRGSFSILFARCTPPKIHRVFANTPPCQSTMNLALYIYPPGNPPLDIVFLLSLVSYSLLPACPHCRSISSCFQYSNGLEFTFCSP